MKNLNERKQFWQYQNPKFIPVKKETKVKPYDQTGSNSQMNRKGSFGTNSFYSKNRKPSFGPNTKDHNRKPSFGPNTKVQNQKPSFGPSTITQNQKLSFDPNNRAQNRMSGLGHKSHSPQSKPEPNSEKDFKGKGKLVSDSKVNKLTIGLKGKLHPENQLTRNHMIHHN